MNVASTILRAILIVLLPGLAGELQGQITWRRTYGGFDSNVGTSVRVTPDGGYILAGSTGSFGAGGQAYVIKIDANGYPEWYKNLGDAGVQTGMACRVVDDGYIVAGSTSTGDYGGYDMFLVRLSGSGEVLWQRFYGTSGWDLCNDVEATSDGFVLAGVSYAVGGGDGYAVRTDLEGDTIWTRTFGGAGFDEALGVFISTDDAAILTGSMTIEASGASPDAFVAKIASDGATSWITTLGGDSADYFYSTVETADGGFACSGGTKSYSNVKQILLAKVNSTGDSLWQEEIGTMGDSEGREIQLTLGGDLAIASYNSYANAGGKDMVLFLASSNGGFILGKNYGGLADEDGCSVQCTPDGGYITIGTAEGYGPGLRSIYVVKGDTVGETADDTVYEMFDDTGLAELQTASAAGCSLFPNPATTNCSLSWDRPIQKAQINDMQGRMVRIWTSPGLKGLDLVGLTDGVYQVIVFDASGGHTCVPLVISAH